MGNAASQVANLTQLWLVRGQIWIFQLERFRVSFLCIKAKAVPKFSDRHRLYGCEESVWAFSWCAQVALQQKLWRKKGKWWTLNPVGPFMPTPYFLSSSLLVHIWVVQTVYSIIAFINPLGPRPAAALSLWNPMWREVIVSNDPSIQL